MASRNERRRKARERKAAILAALAKASKAVDRRKIVNDNLSKPFPKRSRIVPPKVISVGGKRYLVKGLRIDNPDPYYQGIPSCVTLCQSAGARHGGGFAARAIRRGDAPRKRWS